jgi:hypothetical protein
MVCDDEWEWMRVLLETTYVHTCIHDYYYLHDYHLHL